MCKFENDFVKLCIYLPLLQKIESFLCVSLHFLSETLRNTQSWNLKY